MPISRFRLIQKGESLLVELLAPEGIFISLGVLTVTTASGSSIPWFNSITYQISNVDKRDVATLVAIDGVAI